MRERFFTIVKKNSISSWTGQELSSSLMRRYPLRGHDFTYISPAVKHALTNESNEPLEVVVMGFKIPPRVALSPPPQRPRIVNLDALKEEPVQGHPMSVLYKLMVGPRKATRDAIDDAYVVTSLFWMDFAPGGTNFPHHHETAEEIYLVVDGEGRDGGGKRYGRNRSSFSRQGWRCVLLSSELYRRLLQREQAGSEGTHRCCAIAHSIERRGRLA